MNDDSADGGKTSVVTKLDAQTLFAFGADTFSSAFSDAKQFGMNVHNDSTPVKIQVNPWSLTNEE